VHTLTQNIVLSLQPKYHTREFAKASVTLKSKSTLSGLSCGQAQLNHYSIHPCMTIQPLLGPGLPQQVSLFLSVPSWSKYYFQFYTYAELISSLLNNKKISHHQQLPQVSQNKIWAPQIKMIKCFYRGCQLQKK